MKVQALPLLLALVAVTGAQAASVPVEDRAPDAADTRASPGAAVSGPASEQNGEASNRTASRASGRALAELLMTLSQLEQEVRFLRGRLEEQGRQLQQLEERGRDRYRDMDRRLSRLAEGLRAQPAASAGAAPATRSQESGGLATGQQTSAMEAYKAAFALVRETRYEAALEAFADFRQNYPQSPLSANVLYWTGEVQRARPQPDLDAARDAYRQLLDDYPDHDKVPEALYKLGLTLDELGRKEAARARMEAVLERFPEHSTAQLARDFLEQ